MVHFDTRHLSLSGNELYGVLDLYVSFRSEERDAPGLLPLQIGAGVLGLGLWLGSHLVS